MTSIFKSDESKATLVKWFERFRDKIEAPTQGRRVETRFGPTHVLVGGPEDGPALVLLHGAMITSAHTLHELSPLLERFRVYAVDIVGNSVMSDAPPLSVANDDYGHWLVEVLDALGLERPHVMGVSFGGFVALRLAAVAPERIERLALLAPAGVVRSHWSGWYKIGIPMTRYLMSPRPERLAAFLRHMLTTPDPDWEQYMGEVFQAVHLARVKIPRLAKVGEFAAMQAPTLAIGGELDLSFPGAPLLARLTKLLPAVETELIPNCRHCPPTTPEFRRWLADRVSTFLVS